MPAQNPFEVQKQRKEKVHYIRGVWNKLLDRLYVGGDKDLKELSVSQLYKKDPARAFRVFSDLFSGLGDMGSSLFRPQVFQDYELSTLITNKKDRVNTYRTMAANDRIAQMVDEICDMGLQWNENDEIFSIDFDSEDSKINKNVRTNLEKEWYYLLNDVLGYKKNLYDIYSQFIIDGEIYCENIISKETPEEYGIIGVRYLPSEFMFPIYQNNKITSFVLTNGEFNYISDYSVVGLTNKDIKAIELYPEQVSHATSGAFRKEKMFRYPISILDRCIKNWRQLEQLETAIVIYRIIRAPARRLFIIDTGGLPKTKAENYVLKLMNNFRQGIKYDDTTGTIIGRKSTMSMIDDIWLPTSTATGKAGTRIEHMPEGTSLGEIGDIWYFVDKLYGLLNIPRDRQERHVNRGAGSREYPVGTGGITKEEIKFANFVERLNKRFCDFFRNMFYIHLSIKGLAKQYQLQNNHIKIKMNAGNIFKEYKKQELISLKLRNKDAFPEEWFWRKIYGMDEKEYKEFAKMQEETTQEEITEGWE